MPSSETELIGWIGTITSVSMLSSPLQGALRMRKARVTSGRQPQQYIAVVMSSFLWVLYGFLRNSPSVIFCNGVGTVSGSLCLVIYVQVLCWEFGGLSAAVVRKSLQLLSIAALGCALFASYAFSMRKYADTVSYIGYSAAVCSVWMFAAPLAQIKMILQTKSVVILTPLLLGLATINTTIWALYGLVGRDLPMLIPQVLGLALTLPQIALYLKFRHNDANEQAGGGQSQGEPAPIPTHQKQLEVLAAQDAALDELHAKAVALEKQGEVLR